MPNVVAASADRRIVLLEGQPGRTTPSIRSAELDFDKFVEDSQAIRVSDTRYSLDRSADRPGADSASCLGAPIIATGPSRSIGAETAIAIASDGRELYALNECEGALVVTSTSGSVILPARTPTEPVLWVARRGSSMWIGVGDYDLWKGQPSEIDDLPGPQWRLFYSNATGDVVEAVPMCPDGSRVFLPYQPVSVGSVTAEGYTDDTSGGYTSVIEVIALDDMSTSWRLEGMEFVVAEFERSERCPQ